MFDPKLILAKNVAALMRHHYGRENKSRLATDANTAIGNIQRIMDTNTSVGVDLVALVAKAFDLQVWQLMFPDLDPRNPPVLCITASEKNLYSRFQVAAEELAQYNVPTRIKSDHNKST